MPPRCATSAASLLAEALAAFSASRASEGERIAEMLTRARRRLRRIAKQVAARLPEVHERIREAAVSGSPAHRRRANPERLEQEIALLAQKMDVAEELDRLRSHVAEIFAALAADEAGRHASSTS